MITDVLSIHRGNKLIGGISGSLRTHASEKQICTQWYIKEKIRQVVVATTELIWTLHTFPVGIKLLSLSV